MRHRIESSIHPSFPAPFLAFGCGKLAGGKRLGKKLLCVCDGVVVCFWYTLFACYLKHSILKCTENGECWVLWLQKGEGGRGDTLKVLVGLALVSGSESLLNKDFIPAVR